VPGGHIEIQGLKELTDKLQTLPARVEGKIARSALRAGANAILPQAKANAPVGPDDTGARGWLKRSIKVRAAKKRRPGRVLILVTAGRGAQTASQAIRAFTTESGWHSGKRTQGMRRAQDAARRKHVALRDQADSRKFHAGTAWMQRAFDAKQRQAAAAIEQKLAEGIEAAMK